MLIIYNYKWAFLCLTLYGPMLPYARKVDKGQIIYMVVNYRVIFRKFHKESFPMEKTCLYDLRNTKIFWAEIIILQFFFFLLIKNENHKKMTRSNFRKKAQFAGFSPRTIQMIRFFSDPHLGVSIKSHKNSLRRWGALKIFPLFENPDQLCFLSLFHLFCTFLLIFCFNFPQFFVDISIFSWGSYPPPFSYWGVIILFHGGQIQQ